MTYENGQTFRAFASTLERKATALSGAVGLCLVLLLGACSVGSDAPPGDFDSAGAGSTVGAGGGVNPSGGSNQAGSAPSVGTTFELRPEFDGTCARANIIDVNLGNSAEKFVAAAYCQVNGTPAPDNVVSEWAGKLRTLKYVRRIDVVLGLCKTAGRGCPLSYSDPWLQQSDLSTPCTRSGTRDLGAVLMFWNDCPGGTNCAMGWANTHAAGMAAVSPLLSFAPAPSGIYSPKNPGFWRRELIDAAYAGVQFFLLNVFGPDLSASVDPLVQLSKALADTSSPVKIGLFDDTYSWGKSTGAFAKVPDFVADPDGAAQTIYDAKWKPFFTRVPQANWYLIDNRPLVYFYNAGTLKRDNAAAVISGLRTRFQADFGVSPFVAVDEAFFQDPNMQAVADGRFNWDTFRTGQISEQTMNGVRIDHFMPKWDSLGRDHAGQIATEADRLVKDDSLLKQRLEESKGSRLTTIGTWNDMGEGTGITRNYDYYAGGEWLEPDTFLKDIRAVQCSN